MNWSKGFFRMWIALSVIWVIIVGLFSYESIENPYFSWGGYLYSQDTSETPKYMERYSNDFEDAERRHKAGELTQYEIKIDGTRYDTMFFLPGEMTKEEQVKLIGDYVDRARADQLELKKETSWQNVISAIQGATIPPLILLAIGFGIRWVITGFRRPVETQS